MPQLKPLQLEAFIMAVIYPHFLKSLIDVHINIQNQIPYPFFDNACIYYEALRTVHADGKNIQMSLQKYGLTEYAYQKKYTAFQKHGVAGLIGDDSKQLTEKLPVKSERMIFVLKKARPWIPATKMVTILKGFNYNVSLSLMRHLYASHGWATGTRSYKNIDFWSLNLKVINLCNLRSQSVIRKSFFDNNDRLQTLIEIFRTMGTRGITRLYSGSRVSFNQHKNNFLSLGLLGLIDRARSPFRNSKLGFTEEGQIVLSKIQDPDKNKKHYLKILETKKIQVSPTCLTNIFTRWKVDKFRSKFVGDIKRLSKPEDLHEIISPDPDVLPTVRPIRLDKGFNEFLKNLYPHSIPIANPGIFLFLPYLNKLKIFEKASTLMDLDPDKGYSWFSLLLLNLGRIFEGISSVSKACRTNELSLPIMSGLVSMPCNDSLLNGLAILDETQLLQLRQHLTQMAKRYRLIEGKRIAFDFNMRDFTGDDIKLKNIGKGPSPKRKICFPGFRPHIAWDVDTGTPITIEFRNGKARATTTVKRFILELLQQSIGKQGVEHVYFDSEYTAEHVWQFIVDPETGLGADLTMCIKQNRKVKKYIKSFMDTNPAWLFFDEDHTYSEQTFEIPIQETGKSLRCVIKRNEKNGRLRCFGSTLIGLNSKGILTEYRTRWKIENGIKDLIENYFFDHIPGIDPHRINIHYFMVTLARILFEMFSLDYQESKNHDDTKKTLDTLRPEFLVGSNATLSQSGKELVLKWKDYYTEKQHQVLKNLFTKLNDEADQELPFLGGLKLRFEVVPPRPEEMRNQLKRGFLEF
jgi:hypothetical protein